MVAAVAVGADGILPFTPSYRIPVLAGVVAEQVQQTQLAALTAAVEIREHRPQRGHKNPLLMAVLVVPGVTGAQSVVVAAADRQRQPAATALALSTVAAVELAAELVLLCLATPTSLG